MTTWVEQYAREGRPNLGMGVSVPPGTEPVPVDILWEEFKLGLVASESFEKLPQGAGYIVTDMEVSPGDSLVRAPGATLLEDVNPRSPLYIFEHAGLDYNTELVIVDPPYIGRKASAANFVFDNLGIAVTSVYGWTVCNVAGRLIISNGLSATYLRTSGAAVVTDISAQIIAQTFATSFGRTFAGAYQTAGVQSMGIRWNAASGDPADWLGTGSGAQLLLSNSPEADRIVAMRPIGFDVLAVLTRKGIWFGYPTRIANEPADFRVRFPGNGCVAEPTAVVTPFGVVYLSDNGVILVDLNNVKNISTEINPLILPIDYLHISEYKAVYDNSHQRYILQTPTGVFVYEFARGEIPARWFFRSIIPKSMVMFTDQTGSVFWDTIIGSWSVQTQTWVETVISEQNVNPTLYYTRGTKVEYADPAAMNYNGDAMTPLWASGQVNPKITDEATTSGIEIEFRSVGESIVKFWTTDSSGDFNNSVRVTLPDTGGAFKTGYIPYSGSGKGLRIKYEIVSGEPELFRMRQEVMPAGPTLESLYVA